VRNGANVVVVEYPRDYDFDNDNEEFFGEVLKTPGSSA